MSSYPFKDVVLSGNALKAKGDTTQRNYFTIASWYLYQGLAKVF